MSLLPLSLLLLSLLSANDVPSVQTPCNQDSSPIHLDAESVGAVPVVCISKHAATTLAFDSALKEAYVEGDEKTQVTFRGKLLTLVAATDVASDKPLRLKLMFEDTQAPLLATLHLFVDAFPLPRQTSVKRMRRTMASYQEEVRELRTKNKQLQREIERLRGQGHREPPPMGPPPSMRATADTEPEPEPEPVRLALRERPGGGQHHLAPLFLH